MRLALLMGTYRSERTHLTENFLSWDRTDHGAKRYGMMTKTNTRKNVFTMTGNDTSDKNMRENTKYMIVGLRNFAPKWNDREDGRGEG